MGLAKTTSREHSDDRPYLGVLTQYSKMAGQSEITGILARMTAGEDSAEAELLPLVYENLRKIALAQLRSERSEHTLQATALVDEAYLRLCGSSALPFNDRVHFSGYPRT